MLGVNSTGYFGSQTQASVIQWQSAHNLPATGYVGPMTIAAIRSSCGGGGSGGGGSTQSSSFTANPTYGSAPLTVTFSDPSGLTYGSSYIINYGDGSSSGPITATACAMPMLNSASGANGYGCLPNTVHTYQGNGTYTATLTGYIACMYATPYHCDMAAIAIGSVTISVSTGVTTGSSGLTASPTSGSAPLYVYFTSSISGSITFGDGSTGTMSEVYPPCASSATNCGPYFSVSHTYSSPNTYTATLTPACQTGMGITCVAPQSTTVNVLGTPAY
jgi:PKD repeat protein